MKLLQCAIYIAAIGILSNPIAHLLTRLVIILGACEVAEKATGLITGILADNAGWQSITAGDMSGTAKSVVAKAEQKAMGAAKSVGGVGLGAAGLAATVGVKAATGVGVAGIWGAYGAGKLAVTGGKAVANKISAWRNSGAGESTGTTGGGTSTPAGGGSVQSTETPPTTKRPPTSLRNI